MVLCGLQYLGKAVFGNLNLYDFANKILNTVIIILYVIIYRYRSPIKKVENGLVRVTLNENPIGDEGAKKLATKLAEDLWIKGRPMH
jgi:hypothetical protein